MDILDTERRSRVMAAIRSTGNLSTEVALARALRRNGVTGWRRHLPIRIGHLAIRPDFVFRKTRLAVFVDGCFWHQCPLHATLPATRRNQWRLKLKANKARDLRSNRALGGSGWRVLRIWEHAVVSNADACARRVLRANLGMH
jgi:DNA mismatch endonuclease (patch repair protein)